MMPGIEPVTHWWETSALTTAPTLLPNDKKQQKQNQKPTEASASVCLLLATVLAVYPVHGNDTYMISFLFYVQSKDDSISGVELLAYIPYFVAVAAKDT